MIASTVTDAVYQKIMDKETAFEAWESLRKQFEATSKDQLFKICRVFAFSWVPGEDISTHIAKLSNLWNELNNGLEAREESKLPDLMLVCKVLHILPSQFETFKSSWMLLAKDDKKSFEELTVQKAQEALIATKLERPKQEGKYKSKSRKEDSCNYCKRKGHRTSLTSYWIDNGATRHVTNCYTYFVDLIKFDSPCGIKAAGNETLAALGKGTIKVKSTINGKCQEVILKDVWYVPKINRNLFFVLAAQDRNPNSEFVSTPTKCWLKVNDDVVLYGSRNVNGSLFKANFEPILPKEMIEVHTVIADSSLLQLYHERWGHQDKRHIRNMLEKELGIHIKLDKELCELCIYGKAHILSFGTREKASEPGELISADVCAPFDESFQKKKYLVVFKDSFTKFRYGYLIKEKSEVKKVLEHMLAHTRTLGYSVKEFLRDNGGEFDNKDVQEILHSNGVTQRLTVPYTPEKNGASEREMRTTIEMARTLKYSNPEVSFLAAIWAELVNSAIYILNRTGKSSIENTSPYELWLKKKPRLKHLRIIGSPSYAHVPAQKRRKMVKKAIQGYLVGYDGDERLRIWLKKEHKDNPIEKTLSQEDLSDSETDREEDAEPTLDRQLRNRSLLQKPKRFEDHIMEADSYLDDYNPETYEEAINSKDSTNWKKAMESEMNSLSENHILGSYQTYQLELKQYPVSGFIDSKQIQMAASINIKQDWLQEALVNARALITVKHTAQ
ncbi:retrovirus-related Pol polyprotein from transposon TNT 1-94 [Trichonephila clavipes]|nr:retrovirus-related Pol polyprotein from transposon TNT 1-94 [Trichonephila clavipes]